ncbi:serine/threonine-protein kinase [Mycobacterium sp. MYCO198283]|uniref:serine/threonine-protein kinase n=1 Tax=Mycobacterium sp. MYCO198283 TaxID=2883505 RepID=UPI00272E20BA|nr:serine/threonine-protein kinase [Mycobacterium sp. MYCO198283]
MPLTNGELFAGYRIVRLLGSGGMGEVYLARHPRLPRHDALKVLPPQLSADPDYRARFSREADMAAMLFHPHIVGVHDRGEFNGQLWISMDYIDGTDAGQLAHASPGGMPLDDVLEIVSAVADALDYAHDTGLLHRDVKPGNILITQQRRRVLLADFGIARPLDGTRDLTRTNMAVGTVTYAAPEQLAGRRMDGRADQYALAVTTYHLLTGAPPYDDPNAVVVATKHTTAPVPRLSARRPDLAALDQVFATAMAKDPAGRFRRCEDFARALARPPAQKPPTAVLPTPPVHQQPTYQPPPHQPPTHRPTVRPTHQPPTHQPPTHQPSARWPIIVGAAIALLLIVAVLLTHPWRQSSGANTSVATPSTSASASASQSASGFDAMRELVTAYYADLPDRPDEAWQRLDPGYQQQTGEQNYREFWATIQAVELDSVTPRDATSVVAQLTYVLRNGSRQSEKRWLSTAQVNGTLKITGSARIGPA